ncbi:ATP-binding cassette domain-containing protein [Candidatus Izemoplasma sp. B36]|uniref:ABC transporter ATP-binding protein/permease n=1 Tax=Candidatus Izemoplasma sp. B36 TaxID=3242468 RepID=UPI003558BD42
MLELKNLTKNYYVGDTTVEALKKVNLKFRKNEFVSILGPSGCGKTTMLNIVGGLDQYTDGDLLIDGKSTKQYKDSDWDAYRNTTIGFVFQNYNLISHLTVLENVSMALSLSGVSAKERKERAIKSLDEVGLHDQVYKKPNQLSGGQMQRVAIARALVNNPKILLADEPTGALDTKTSNQIMKLVKEISKDRLVIMVTHNKKIAEEYSDRIINLLDGEIVGDSKPANGDVKLGGNLENSKTSMNFWTAIISSFKNLITKKGRTIITAIAGSIGIVGIALVLAISNGMTSYVSELESDSLAGFPITISSQVQAETFNSGRHQVLNLESVEDFPTESIIYSYDEENSTTMHTNIFTEDVLSYIDNLDSELYNSISYTRAVSLNLITETESGTYDLVEVDNDSSSFMFGSTQAYGELPENQEFVESQYDILAGEYPDAYNEVVLVVDNQNQLDINILEALGFDIESEYSFDDFLGKEYKIIPNDVLYNQVGNIFTVNNDLEAMYNDVESITLNVVGILRVNQEASSEVLNPGIAYTTMLTDYMLNDASQSEIVLTQEADPTINVLTGTSFNEMVTYDYVMKILGGDSTPTGIQIYPVSFEAKDQIKLYLDDYNINLDEESQIIYTDLAEMVSDTISSMVDTITIILAAFAAISLVVSSIMIGIITYVSVIERTKEIGIMRSLGARKKDISRIFTAESLLIGLTSGILGVVFYGILSVPVNAILGNLIGVTGFATLGITYTLGLVLLSSVLTLIAGIIPSKIAANKDPVIALRTE